MTRIDGKQLLEWGLPSGPWFREALEAANFAFVNGGDPKEVALSFMPPPKLPLRVPNELPYYGEFIEANCEDSKKNLEVSRNSMKELLRTPVVSSAVLMPDACPAGPQGTITVGGIAESSQIHPGMHSADICCSVAISILDEDVDPLRLMDIAQKVTHFGPGGRARGKQHRPSEELFWKFAGNEFLTGTESVAIEHFATQGDGNHFLFIGFLESTGELAIVTHHGSRKPGALLYKKGMQVAEKTRQRVSPETLKQNAWIEADSHEGEQYWNALQIIREWTKENHFKIHELLLRDIRVRDQFWNEHNFVFRRGHKFLHAKGATPAWADYAKDASGHVLIPLNMGAPILIAKGLDKRSALSFCPHGAGRNMSRTAHVKNLVEKNMGVPDVQALSHLDIRWYSGIPDTSEMPSAYKSPKEIEDQIQKFGLAKIVDRVLPYGSIMAGDWQKDAPWKKK